MYRHASFTHYFHDSKLHARSGKIYTRDNICAIGENFPLRKIPAIWYTMVVTRIDVSTALHICSLQGSPDNSQSNEVSHLQKGQNYLVTVTDTVCV